MKKFFCFVLLSFSVIELFGQIQGISYQAVLVDQSSQEVPGIDISGNIMPNHDIMIRFTILDAAGTVDYQEEQANTTDAYGMINLTIGQGNKTSASPKSFEDIDWNGTSKQLKVDISLSQTNIFYTDFSLQELTFVPYAYHRNITATGTLKVDNKSTLQDLSVEATTNLDGSLDINNGSPTHMSGILSVDQNTILADTLTVNSASNLNGRVVITATVDGENQVKEHYPLYIQGSNQGIAIKVDGSRTNQNDFITFWDDIDVQGRIEGESIEDVFADPGYKFENAKLLAEAGIAGAKLYAALTAVAPCAGLGACVTTPPTSNVIVAFANLALKSFQIGWYNAYRWGNAGVVYKSKGADYAEFLPKANAEEKMYPGDIVGVKNGLVSLSTKDADKIMVVSGKPIVLGNIPKEGSEDSYARISFMGQVQTKVVGVVNAGNYVIPSGNNDGAGIGISPDSLKAEDYEKIAGVAWSSSFSGFGYINLAVGVNTNNFGHLYMKQEEKIARQEEEIKNLKEQMDQMNVVLAQLIPDYTKLSGYTTTAQNSSASQTTSTDSLIAMNTMKSVIASALDTVSSDSQKDITIIYYDINRRQAAQGLEKAKEILAAQGTLNQYPLFNLLESDPQFRERYIDEMFNAVKAKMNEYALRDLKSGATIIKNY